MKPASVEARLGWLHSDKDVINDQGLISVIEPKSSRRWLVINGFSSWKTRGITKGRETLERETWYRLTCLVVAKANAKKLLSNLTKQRLTSPHALPSLGFPDGAYLGEYPWHPVCAGFGEWDDPRSDISVPTRAVVGSYVASEGGYDYSMDENIHVSVPAPWLMSALSLSLESGQTPRYVDEDGVVQFFDPAVSEPGSHAALIDEATFRNVLKKEGLEPFWVIAGEKSVYGDMWAARGFGGRYVHSAVYALGNDGRFRRHFHSDMELPYEEQLGALFEAEIPREFKKLVRTAPPPRKRTMLSKKALRALSDHLRTLEKRSKRRKS